jgi:hypothetical protein
MPQAGAPEVAFRVGAVPEEPSAEVGYWSLGWRDEGIRYLQ